MGHTYSGGGAGAVKDARLREKVSLRAQVLVERARIANHLIKLPRQALQYRAAKRERRGKSGEQKEASEKAMAAGCRGKQLTPKELPLLRSSMVPFK